MMSTSMSNKVAVSAIVIYNAATVNPILPQTLESLTKAKQLILFDVGNQPITDFARVRNEALKLAVEDYVFFVDSDEVVTAKSWRKIATIVEDSEVDLVSVKRSDVFFGRQLKGGEAGQQSLIRLGKRSKIHFIRAVHEVVEVKDQMLVQDLDIKILHYSHQSLSEFFTKISYYSLLVAKHRGKQKPWRLLVEMLVLPPAKFVFNLILRQGYRDGVRGVIYATFMSLHSLFVRIHGWELRSGKMVR